MDTSSLATIVRVLLRTKTGALRRGCADVAREAGDIELTSSGADLPEFLRLAEASRPDVILLDTPVSVDFACITEVRRVCPKTPVVLWVDCISVEIAHHARAAGVSGVLRKELSDDVLRQCLRDVAAGDLWFERGLLNSLLQVREVRLSPRERQLLRCITQGLSNKQIAGELMISEGTIKVYLAKLFRKVGVHDRYELALHGLRSLGLTASVEMRLGSGQAASFPRSVVLGTGNSRVA